MSAVPTAVCVPKGLDLDPYLRILRRFLEDGETLRSVAFPYEVGTHNFAGVVPAILAKRVDATWDVLVPGRAGVIVEKFASGTFVAVTDRRIVTANPGNLPRLGELGPSYALDEVHDVRGRTSRGMNTRPSIDVVTTECDLHWMFPSAAALEDIDSFASRLSDGASSVAPSQSAIEQSGRPRSVSDD